MNQRRRSKSLVAKIKPGDRLELMLRAHGIGGWVREHRFHPERMWRMDYAWPHHYVGTVHRDVSNDHVEHSTLRFAIEIEGIVGGMRKVPCAKCGTPHLVPLVGRHQTAAGAEEDAIKYEEAFRLGWIVHRVTARRVEKPETIALIRQYVGTGGPMPPKQASIELEPGAPF